LEFFEIIEHFPYFFFAIFDREKFAKSEKRTNTGTVNFVFASRTVGLPVTVGSKLDARRMPQGRDCRWGVTGKFAETR
jgi:hypothetical protein